MIKVTKLKKAETKPVDLIEQYNRELGLESPRREFIITDEGNGYGRITRVSDFDRDRLEGISIHNNSGLSASAVTTGRSSLYPPSPWEMSGTIDTSRMDREILRTLSGPPDRYAYTTGISEPSIIMSQISQVMNDRPVTITSPNGEHRIVIDNNGITFYGNVMTHNEG